MASTEERVSRLEGAYDHLATKADLEDTKAYLEVVRADLKADVAELKVNIADLKVNIADLKAELTWRVAGLQLAGLAAVAAIMGFLR